MKYQYDALLKHVKENEDSFRSYFEAILYPNGEIELARPSHQETLVRYFYKKEGIDSKEELIKLIPLAYNVSSFIIDKYKCVSIWYNQILYSASGLTDIQKEILERMKNDGLIDKSAQHRLTAEYSHYLYYQDKYDLLTHKRGN